MKLIVICGAKNSKKTLLAQRLSSNSDCRWIKPWSDKPVPLNADDTDEFIPISESKLSDKMEKEIPLCVTVIDGHRYVFFENQLNEEFVVLIGDDTILFNIKKNFKGDLLTVKCHSNDETESPRCLSPDSDFDIVFNYDTDDYDYFEADIVYGGFYG